MFDVSAIIDIYDFHDHNYHDISQYHINHRSIDHRILVLQFLLNHYVHGHRTNNNTYYKFKMSVKQEHSLIVKPETKLKSKKSKNDEDFERTETPDNKAEETKIVNTETEPVVEERPIFVCKNCNLTERYDCFNDRVSFNRKLGTKVDYYLARDPFSPRSKRQFLILGSVCCMCDKDVCVKPECSIFYSKFFCSICARKYISNFPTSIQEKIKTTKRI